jgi:hypothetical protein
MGPRYRLLLLLAALAVLGCPEPISPTTKTTGTSIAPTPSQLSTVAKYALVIGIRGYPDFDEADRLKFADRDADAFAAFIESPNGGAFPPGNVRLLRNGGAKRDDIIKAIQWLGTTVTTSDLVYVFFSGHGVLDRLDRAYLMPYNGDARAPENLGIRIDFFLQELQANINPAYLIFFIDACHAGAAYTQGAAKGGLDGNIVPGFNKAFYDMYQSQQGIRMGLLASSSNQKSNEAPEFGHGLFTHFLLEGLKGAASADARGVITAGELSRYVSAQVDAYARAHGLNQQTPIPSPAFQSTFPLTVLRPVTQATAEAGGAPVAAASLAPSPVPASLPPGQEWSGVYYNPVYGYLHLIERPGGVLGRWKRSDGSHWGELSGTVEGNVLHYTWAEHKYGGIGPSATSRGSGVFVYKMGEKFGALEGQFWLAAGSDQVGDWHCVKQGGMTPDLNSIPGEPTSDGIQPSANIRPVPASAPAPVGSDALATPGPLALPCKSDLSCGTHRCNTQYGKCAWPCQTAADCVAPNTCSKGVCTMGPAPAAGSDALATPGPLALPCKSDVSCGTHHCNTQYGKCAWPCQTAADCVAPNTCSKGVCTMGAAP